MAISFFFQDTQIHLSERKRLKAFIAWMFKAKGKGLQSLNYIFCTDDYLLDINRKFLKHDYYTDIITFNLSDDKGEAQGEIYISVDRVRENARMVKATLKKELHRIIFHGALHLCGYTDKTKAQKDRMTAEENRYLSKYLP